MSETMEMKLEAILSRENLEAAWSAVKANDGAAGVDRKTVEQTSAHLKRHWAGIREKLLSGDYQPAAVRAVEIPKANGGTRLLGIPTVQDRLMHLLGGRIADPRVLRLIGRYLRAPMRHADGRQERRRGGTPQGGPLSPLLANLYLDPLDKELERRGIAFVRYADDIALFLSSERAAQRVLESVKAWLKAQLDLEVNEDKSGAWPGGDSQLPGFRIHESGDVSASPKALVRLKARVRQLWDARQSLTSEELRAQWQRYITGWWNYFGYANWRWRVKALSGWIRRHMRKCFWLRWHNRQGRRNALCRLGVSGRRLGVAGCRRGAWPMSRHVVVQQALKTATLNRYGFTLPWELAG